MRAPFPASAYLDDGVLAAERRAIFERAWLCVGREDEIERPGAWLLAPVAPEGVIVARGPDLAVRAFRNVCRHRGALLVREPCGVDEHLACPYHGWTYDLTGALRRGPVDASLAPVRVAAWRGFLFVCADAATPPLDAWLGELPPWLAAVPLELLARAHRAEHEVAANWKLLVENFQESHHFPRVHPGLERRTPSASARTWSSAGPWQGGIMELLRGAETVSTTGLRRGRALVGTEGLVHDAMLFPTLLTSVQPDYVLTYRLAPLAPWRTRIVFEILVHPSSCAGIEEVVAFWERTNAEDRAICESQQVGIASPGWVSAGYMPVEEGAQAFDRLVAAALGREP